MKKAGSTEINLLTGSDRRSNRLTAFISLALIIGVLAGGGNCCLRKEQQNIAKMVLVNRDLAAQIETRPTGLEEMQTVMKMQLTIDELSPLLAELETNRMPFVTILEGIYNLIPPDTRLDKIAMGDSRAIIYGNCLNNGLVAQLLDGLKSLPRFGGLVRMQSKLDQSGQGTEFAIEIALTE